MVDNRCGRAHTGGMNNRLAAAIGATAGVVTLIAGTFVGLAIASDSPSPTVDVFCNPVAGGPALEVPVGDPCPPGYH
jgi:hypothetical protein